MLSMPVHFGDNAWPDLKDKDFIHHKDEIKVAVLDAGVKSGRPSVALRLDLLDGQVVLAETSARLFCLASNMIVAKYPDLFQD